MVSERKNENRSFARVKADFVVLYRLDEPLRVKISIDNRETNAVMVDLSEGGLAIKTEEDIAAGIKLLINFIIVNVAIENEDEQIKAMNIKGKVCNNASLGNGEYRLGVSFTQINDDDRKFIAKFVKMVSEGHEGQE